MQQIHYNRSYRLVFPQKKIIIIYICNENSYNHATNTLQRIISVGVYTVENGYCLQRMISVAIDVWENGYSLQHIVSVAISIVENRYS